MSKNKRPKQAQPAHSLTPNPTQAPVPFIPGVMQPPQAGLAVGIQVNHPLQVSPFPPPELIAAYDETGNERGERVFKMVEEEQSHRHNLDRTAVEYNQRGLKHEIIQGYLGQIFAFILSIMSLGAAFWLLSEGKAAESLVTLILPLAGLAGAFLKRLRPEKTPPAIAGDKHK